MFIIRTQNLLFNRYHELDFEDIKSAFTIWILLSVPHVMKTQTIIKWVYVSMTKKRESAANNREVKQFDELEVCKYIYHHFKWEKCSITCKTKKECTKLMQLQLSSMRSINRFDAYNPCTVYMFYVECAEVNFKLIESDYYIWWKMK